jgi:hypothetical protein
MASVSQNIESWKAKLDKVLHEENAATDVLAKVEAKTGVRRLYIALSEYIYIHVAAMCMRGGAAWSSLCRLSDDDRIVGSCNAQCTNPCTSVWVFSVCWPTVM